MKSGAVSSHEREQINVLHEYVTGEAITGKNSKQANIINKKTFFYSSLLHILFSLGTRGFAFPQTFGCFTLCSRTRFLCSFPKFPTLSVGEMRGSSRTRHWHRTSITACDGSRAGLSRAGNEMRGAGFEERRARAIAQRC